MTEALGTPEEFARLGRMAKDGELSLRVTYAFAMSPGFSEADYGRFQRARQAWSGSPWLKGGVIKVFLDGVPQAHTAFLLAPYGPQPETGQPVHPPAVLKRWVTRFDRDGWQVMTHAMGDGAVRLALDAYEGAAAANGPRPKGRRHRIEHAFLIDPTDLRRFGSLGVTAAYQPTDVFLPPTTATDPPDPKRPPQDGARWNAVSAAGGVYSLGSDWPVFSMNPLARIYAIANSRRAEQRAGVVELLQAYTRYSAYTTFDEAERGTLEPGKLADIAILSRDIIAAPPQTAQDLAVDMTLVGGRVVFERDQSARTPGQ